VGDVCEEGLCLSGPSPCPSIEEPCLASICDPLSGACSVTPDGEGDVCPDASACVTGSVCVAGACQGTPLDCDDKDPCTQDACDGEEGCTHEDQAGPCDDGDLCTVGDTCQGGLCQSGEALACDDQSPCTVDYCEDDTGACNHDFPFPDGVVCSDGNPCTQGDACGDGACVAGINGCECEADDDCAPLEDGDLCNGTLICQGNACVIDPLTPVSCDDSLDTYCEENLCDTGTGLCAMAAVNEGAACDDGSACTYGETCSTGACAQGTDVVCSSGTPCLEASCDPESGCVLTDTDAPCDADEDACTASDQCQGGLCMAGTPVVCPSSEEACQVLTCEASSGDCVAQNLASGAP
jgi:hypothetical protein